MLLCTFENHDVAGDASTEDVFIFQDMLTAVITYPRPQGIFIIYTFIIVSMTLLE